MNIGVRDVKPSEEWTVVIGSMHMRGRIHWPVLSKGYKYEHEIGTKSSGSKHLLDNQHTANPLSQSHPLPPMDSFTAIITFFSTSVDDAITEQFPVNEEGEGNGGGAYCVVA